MSPLRPMLTVALAAAVLAAPSATARAVVRPPAGIPDLTAMTLTLSDLPDGAIVSRQGFDHDPPAAAAFYREFSLPRRSGLAAVLSEADFFPDANDAFLDFAVVRGAMFEAKVRAKLARLGAKSLGLPTRHVTAGRARDVDLGDGAVILSFTVRRHGRRITGTESFLVLDRILTAQNVAGAPGAGRVVSRSRALLTAMRDHIHAALLPVATVPPAITNTGGVLHAEPGTWSEATKPTSFAYRWQRCDASGAECTTIAGAIGQDYTVTPQDAGSTLRVVVTARNRVGSTTAVSGVAPA